MAEVTKMMDRIQANMDKSEKMMALMATILQTLIKDTLRKYGEGPPNEGEKDDDKKKEKKGERIPQKLIHDKIV